MEKFVFIAVCVYQNILALFGVFKTIENPDKRRNSCPQSNQNIVLSHLFRDNICSDYSCSSFPSHFHQVMAAQTSIKPSFSNTNLNQLNQNPNSFVFLVNSSY